LLILAETIFTVQQRALVGNVLILRTHGAGRKGVRAELLNPSISQPGPWE
jgi:hypothetical protein